MAAPEASSIEVSEALLRRLLEAQFPEWAHLSLARIAPSSPDHGIFRLGEELAIRLPLVRGMAPQVEKERRWLTWLSVRLPQSIPIPVANGRPTEDYPLPWTICRWIPGRSLRARVPDQPEEIARQLGRFVRCLSHLDARGGPVPGEHNGFRGAPLKVRDARTREGISQCEKHYDPELLVACWERDAGVPEWHREPVWVHGDLSPDTLVEHEGRLAGVLDWGGLGVGDPAADLLPAWDLFETTSRSIYREQLGVDEATWRRGRGLALSLAVVALSRHRGKDSVADARASRVIEQVLLDHAEA